VNLTIIKESAQSTQKFIVTETNDENTILIGNETLKEIEKTKSDVEELKSNFKSLFDEDTNDCIENIECTIETFPGKIVMVKQRPIAHYMIEVTVNLPIRNRL
jgi:hypothetical protein